MILRIKRRDVSNDYLLTNIYDLFYLATLKQISLIEERTRNFAD